MLSATEPSPERISALNDAFRQDGTGDRIMLTSGVAALGPTKVALITEAVSSFAAFTPDNDPLMLRSDPSDVGTDQSVEAASGPEPRPPSHFTGD